MLSLALRLLLPTAIRRRLAVRGVLELLSSLISITLNEQIEEVCGLLSMESVTKGLANMASVELSQRMMEEQGVFLNELSEEFFETNNKLHRANLKKEEILKEIQRDLKIPIGTFLDPSSILSDEFHHLNQSESDV